MYQIIIVNFFQIIFFLEFLVSLGMNRNISSAVYIKRIQNRMAVETYKLYIIILKKLFDYIINIYIIQTMEEDSSTNNNNNPTHTNKNVGKRIHRRTKNEISGVFVCGDTNCSKSYGTNAALYTHIKQKHNGVEPMGTVRPKTLPIRGRKGRPVAEEQPSVKVESSEICKICGYKECKCIEKFDVELIKLYSEESFVDFIKEIGSFGEDGQLNVWVRHVDADIVTISKEKIEQLIQRFKDEYNLQIRVSSKFEKYLLNTIRFWCPETYEELYQGILCTSHFKKEAVVREFMAMKPPFKRFLQQVAKHPQNFQNLHAILRSL